MEPMRSCATDDCRSDCRIVENYKWNVPKLLTVIQWNMLKIFLPCREFIHWIFSPHEIGTMYFIHDAWHRSRIDNCLRCCFVHLIFSRHIVQKRTHSRIELISRQEIEKNWYFGKSVQKQKTSLHFNTSIFFNFVDQLNWQNRMYHQFRRNLWYTSHLSTFLFIPWILLLTEKRLNYRRFVRNERCIIYSTWERHSETNGFKFPIQLNYLYRRTLSTVDNEQSNA